MKGTLYICKRCKTLLLIVDKKTSRFDTSMFDVDNIEYISFDHGEEDFESFHCPMCSCNTENKTLEEIEVDSSILKSLFNIWDNIKIDEEEDVRIEWGIPLENEDLKIILFENKVKNI